MSEMGVWFKPVTMTEIDLPELKVSGNFVLTAVEGGMELTRCTGTGESLSLDDAGENIISIGLGALSNTDALKSVILPRSVTRVEDFGFYQCEHLVDVRIMGNLRSIGARCFAGCKSLKNLYVPPTVTFIGEDAFRGVPDLILSGAENSAVHRYAQENGLSFMIASGPSAA